MHFYICILNFRVWSDGKIGCILDWLWNSLMWVVLQQSPDTKISVLSRHTVHFKKAALVWLKGYPLHFHWVHNRELWEEKRPPTFDNLGSICSSKPVPLICKCKETTVASSLHMCPCVCAYKISTSIWPSFSNKNEGEIQKCICGLYFLYCLRLETQGDFLDCTIFRENIGCQPVPWVKPPPQVHVNFILHFVSPPHIQIVFDT